MPDIPTMTLKAAPMQFAAFTPVQYQAKPIDMSILQTALAQREANMKQAAQAQASVNVDLSKIKGQIHTGEETTKWFNSFQNNINKQISDQLEAGNYTAAFNTATKLGSNILTKPEVAGRIKYNSDWNAARQKADQRTDVNDIEKNWWLNAPENQYNYKDIYDSEGNIVSGTIYNTKTPLVASLNEAQLWADYSKAHPPKKYSSSSGGGSDVVNDDGTGSGSKWSSESSVQELSSEELLKDFPAFLNAQPQYYAQVEQAYNARMYKYEQLKAQYTSMSDTDPNKQKVYELMEEYKQMLFDKNNEAIGPIGYGKRIMNNQAMAELYNYRWTSTGSTSFSSVDNQTSASSNSNGNGNGNGNGDGSLRLPDQPSTDGPRVKGGNRGQGGGGGNPGGIHEKHQQNNH